MDKHIAEINGLMSLRAPLQESLEILAGIANLLPLRKDVDLAAEQKKVKAHTAKLAKRNGTGGIFTEFERDFPCVCFALATGVGKTRLMGAFITWLSRAKGMKNFLVLAPNLTIYNKLIEDFSNPRSPKYVFPGIGEFGTNQPAVITGDNYISIGSLAPYDDTVRINIFNISKINAVEKGKKLPKIKRLSEYIGQSYFDKLVNTDDLVILMDESHHYRAERGIQVINELKPVLGIELTATPKTETGGTKLFKNVVYQFGLKKAMTAGFVKEPFVATRMDLEVKGYSDDELDRLKLEDGIRVHRDTKVALELYARDNKKPVVKPFVLVVTKETGHAARIKALIQSKAFYKGEYHDKVMEIHSNQKGEEKEENIQKLLTLENPKNSIEIVIHVNMLKEGWDVTNLYTIIPLRSSASETLTEQTIGRGLRLPYGGQRTGNKQVDKLTIISHDNFQRLLAAADQPDSIINRENIIALDEETTGGGDKEALTANNRIDERMDEERARLDKMPASKAKEKAVRAHELIRVITQVIPSMGSTVTSIGDLKKEKNFAIMAERVKERYAPAQPKADFIKEFKEIYGPTIDEFIRDTIAIPCISIHYSEEVKTGYRDFKLKAAGLDFKPTKERIITKSLEDKSHQDIVDAGVQMIEGINPATAIVEELRKKSQIDYDSQADLIFRLIEQALDKLGKGKSKDQVDNIVRYHAREIAEFIYEQMEKHFYREQTPLLEPSIRPFTAIEPHNYSKIKEDRIFPYDETIKPDSDIPKKVFTGFKKACHSLYKFDSKPEKEFASLLEREKNVLKWLRSAPKQFRIYWDNSGRNYEPDFVAETGKTIYLVEVKRKDQMKDAEVKAKAKAALEYCKHASAYNLKHGGKEWKYLLIPDSEIKPNMSITFLADKHEVKG